MKFAWNVLSVIAVANMLALLMFVGWLKAGDRLDRERMHEVRQAFAKTGAQRKADDAGALAKAEADRKLAAERAKEGTPPVTAAEALDLKIQLSQLDQARVEAIRREITILQDTLRRERQAVEADRATLTKDREEFEHARRVVADTEGNAQFKKTLATYESLKPDKSKAALRQLIELKQVDQAVAYLNAMQERSRTRIIDEFLKDDPKMATDLLERLRTRGMLARGPEGPVK
jgi:flagellar motility protein MotE (MotC chaperone)